MGDGPPRPLTDSQGPMVPGVGHGKCGVRTAMGQPWSTVMAMAMASVALFHPGAPNPNAQSQGSQSGHATAQ